MPLLSRHFSRDGRSSSCGRRCGPEPVTTPSPALPSAHIFVANVLRVSRTVLKAHCLALQAKMKFKNRVSANGAHSLSLPKDSVGEEQPTTRRLGALNHNRNIGSSEIQSDNLDRLRPFRRDRRV